MPLPVNLQFGVELTNFAMPLTRTVLKLGTLAAREAIERSGSDELTELKLAHIFGRLQLDAAISTHFRGIVARSNWKALSHFMKDLVLESGSGPTVAQALASDNPALLSMIIHLSFLAWSHEHQSLGQAIAQVVEDLLKERQASTIHGLNYVALLGTISACQQQTAAFSWEPHYKEVEHKFRASTNTPASGWPPEKRSESSSSNGIARAHPSISNKGIPFVILSALLRSLESLQRFPKEYLLDLSCDQGIASVVIWCYHILGLSVKVKLDGGYFHFGDGPYNITINSCEPSQVSAALLQRASMNDPLFTLQKTDLEPYIQSEERAAARGFLRTILERRGEELEQLGYWIVSKCLGHLGQHSESSSCGHEVKFVGADDLNEKQTPVANIRLEARKNELRDQILHAVSLLLDVDLKSFQETYHDPRGGGSRQIGVSWPLIVHLIYAFARVKDRDNCGSVPLSVTTFERLVYEEHLIKQDSDQFSRPVPDTAQCFDLLCQLLLGQRHTAGYSSNAFLVSDRGWSVFFANMDAVDPAEVASGQLHIKLGVPARGGIRKARIVDGITPSTVAYLGYGRQLRPGVWMSKHIGTHVGYEGHDAFTVVQVFDGAHDARGGDKRRLGFRKKQNMCMRFSVLVSCPCDLELSESDRRRTIDDLLWGRSVTDKGFVSTHPEPGSDISKTAERVFHRGDTWYFFVTNNGAARWLGLDGLCSSDISQNVVRLIRGPGCCVRCAINATTGPAVVLL